MPDASETTANPAATDGAAPEAPAFLDVATLIEASVPRRKMPWGTWLAVGVGLALVSSLLTGDSAAGAAVLAFSLLVGGSVAMFVVAARGHRSEQAQVQAVEELVQLRRWPEAAALLQDLLSSPMRMHGSRVQALVFLSGVLTRYHRFDDAIAVQQHLLDDVPLDPSSDFAIRLGRAMAMLRSDRLWDADRAIAELRKIVSGAARVVETERRGNPEAEGDVAAPPVRPTPAAEQSGALALVEIYRDVKTGHPDEALSLFNRAGAALRRQLGARAADAYALAARAAEMLNQHEVAQKLWRDATTLVPPDELVRRYPEVESLRRFAPATWPALGPVPAPAQVPAGPQVAPLPPAPVPPGAMGIS
jgi:hypothetical protein